MKRHEWVIGLVIVLGGCRKLPQTTEAPPVQNAVTDYVDARVQVLHKAQNTAENANRLIQKQQNQVSQTETP